MAEKDDGKKDKDVDLTKQVATLTTLVGTLAGGFDAQKKAIDALTNNVGQLSNMSQEQIKAQQAAAQANQTDDEPEDTFELNDLEGMDRSAFMDVILNKVNKGFDKLSEQITGQVDKVKETVSTSNIQVEYDKVVAKNPDFNHYKAEIAELAKQNPEMSIKNMYTLAKANNPEKVAEVTKLIKKETEQKQVEDAAEDKKTKAKGYGGLTPTSGQRQELPSDMTQESAGASAWDETMADIELEQ